MFSFIRLASKDCLMMFIIMSKQGRIIIIESHILFHRTLCLVQRCKKDVIV